MSKFQYQMKSKSFNVKIYLANMFFGILCFFIQLVFGLCHLKLIE